MSENGLRSHGQRDVGFVEAVAGRENSWRGVLVEEEVDDIEEAFQSTVLEVLTNGNEDGRDTGGDTDGVLNVEVLWETVRVCRRSDEATLTASIPASLGD